MAPQKVILAVHYLYGLDKCMVHNLAHCGFETINLCYDERKTHYPNLFSRLRALYYKWIAQDLDYKKQLRYRPFLADIEQKLSIFNPKNQELADFALCISANVYPKHIIQKIKENSRLCIGYQWDGIERYPEIFEYLDFFDDFFVFDERDIQKYPQYHFQLTHNFYFDYPIENIEDKKAKNDGFYFVGGYNASRQDETKRLIDWLRHHDKPLDFHIFCKDDRAKKIFGEEGITYLNRNQTIDFETNLINAQQCGVMVDFVVGDHQGLSFRVFEALGYHKKLITTNQSVQYYDFYHENNIFIWDGQDLSGLETFLAQPYVFIDESIRQKYSFSHWIHHLFSNKLNR